MSNSYASTPLLSPWDWAGGGWLGKTFHFFSLSTQGLSLSWYTRTLAASSIPFQFFCFCAFPGALISFLPRCLFLIIPSSISLLLLREHSSLGKGANQISLRDYALGPQKHSGEKLELTCNLSSKCRSEIKVQVL